LDGDSDESSGEGTNVVGVARGDHTTAGHDGDRHHGGINVVFGPTTGSGQ
jgi:hypothetical protein